MAIFKPFLSSSFLSFSSQLTTPKHTVHFLSPLLIINLKLSDLFTLVPLKGTMAFGSIVSSPRGSLSPQQALELANLYLGNACNAKDPDIALVLCHDTEVSLSQAKKAIRRSGNQAVLGGIASAYISLGKLLEKRGLGSEARVSYKKAEKLGGSIQDSAPPKNPRPNSVAQLPKTTLHSTQGSQTSGRLVATVSADIFVENVRPPTVEFKLPESDERLNCTPQLVYCLGLLQAPRLPDIVLEPAAQNWIQAIENDPNEQDRLQVMATEVIRAFKRNEIKDDKAVAEVACLAPVLNKDVFQDLLNEFYNGIDHSGLLNFHHLEGLALMIQGADPGHLSADDLVKILELLSTRLRDTHQQSTQHMHQLTLAVSHVLDAMADTRVKGLDREKLHEPLSSYLNELKNSPDPYLVFQAAYAYQALLCVPDDETAWQAAMRRTGKVIQGVSGLVSAVKGLDLNKFMEGLGDIQKGIEGASKVVEVVKSAYGDVASLAQSGKGFLDSLKEGLTFERQRDWYSALRGADIMIQDGELASFKKLVCEAPCRLDPAFQWGVCQRLGRIAANQIWDANHRQSAVAFLGEIYRNDDVWGQQYTGYANCGTTTGNSCLYCNGFRELFLILGDSGAGKSTFSRELEFELWKSYKAKTGRIPLHINLPAIDKPEHDLIAKHLRRVEFTEPQIREMKDYRKFILICDGYDESQQSHNLYTSNQLNQPGEWDAQMVISCRSEYLGSDYRDRFQPGDRNQMSSSSLFQEAVITPFSLDQVQSYIHQYVLLHQPLWRTDDYKQALELIPSLKELVRNPFLMTLSLEVLPRMVDPGQNLSAARVTRVGLYDHFVEQWLERGKKRLGERELTAQELSAFQRLSDEGFALNGIEYIKTLAAAIYKEQDGHPIVEYSTLVDERTWKSEFFRREDRQLLREACPLTRNGNQHRFIHRSLLEYGLARVVFDPQDRRNRSESGIVARRRGSTSSILSIESQDDTVEEAIALEQEPDINSPLVWRSFVNDHSLMKFLEERVQQEPLFKQQLLAYIEHSKKDKKWRKAAANAITILVRAGVQFIDVDLRGIRIPRADISYGMFDSTRLQGADLRQVNLQSAWLRQTDLSEAQMAGVVFGELPFLTQEGDVYSCAYSPDGKLLAVGTEDGNVYLYMTVNWEKTRTLIGHTDAASCIAFSPSGDQIATASQDFTVQLWEVESGESRRILEHDYWVHGVAFSSRGDLIASCSGRTVQLWDVATGKFIKTLSKEKGFHLSVTYSPNGSQLASGNTDKRVYLWDIESGICSRILIGHSDRVWEVAYSPRGDQVVSASGDKTARIWDVETGTCRHILAGHSNSVHSVAYSPKGDQIATGSKDAAIRLWDVETGICNRTLTGHHLTVLDVTYSPDGCRLASVSMDNDVRLWDVSLRASGSVSKGHNAMVVGVRISPKGDLIASCSVDNTIRLWEMVTGTGRRILSGHRHTVASIRFSPQADRIASCSYDESVRLWDVETGVCLYILMAQRDWIPAAEGYNQCFSELHGINDVEYSPQGNEVASAGLDSSVRRWNVLTGEYRGTLVGHTDGLIASASKDSTIRIWDAETGFCCRILVGHTNWVRCIVYSPQGDLLASAGYDNIVRIWNVETGEPRWTLTGHGDRVACVAFSPQGHLLASGGWDKTVRIWDVTTGQCRVEIPNLPGSIHGVAWNTTSNNNYLITGSYDGSMLKWEIIEDEDRCRVRLCWSVTNGTLAVTGACVRGVSGLTGLNKQLLKQRGAIGEPQHLLREAGKKVLSMASLVSKLKKTTSRGTAVESSTTLLMERTESELQD
ncbi:MAG: WD40-repeat-containing domain protein [Benniella sp.]|nr:MAG: WD40-repeat-containing domain protein [Benniella sp.]